MGVPAARHIGHRSCPVPIRRDETAPLGVRAGKPARKADDRPEDRPCRTGGAPPPVHTIHPPRRPAATHFHGRHVLCARALDALNTAPHPRARAAQCIAPCPAARAITLARPCLFRSRLVSAACLRCRRCRRHARGALRSRSGGGGGGCEQNEVAGQGEGRTVSKGGPASSSACDSCGRAQIGAACQSGFPSRPAQIARRIGYPRVRPWLRGPTQRRKGTVMCAFVLLLACAQDTMDACTRKRPSEAAGVPPA